jgi:hypothetical protein
MLLKMERSDDMILATARILKCLTLMQHWIIPTSGSPMYRKSIQKQLLLLMHLKAKNLPMYHIFKNNLSCFNEESGEVSFSILSRCAINDTRKHDLNHLRTMYRTLNIYWQCKDQIAQDMNEKSIRSWSTSHFKIPRTGPEVTETASFFTATIRKIVNDQFLVYNKKCFKSSLDAAKHAKSEWHPKIYRKKVWNKFVKKEATETVLKLKRRWVGQFRHIWPEGDDSSDDEKSESSDDDTPLSRRQPNAGGKVNSLQEDDGGSPIHEVSPANSPPPPRRRSMTSMTSPVHGGSKAARKVKDRRALLVGDDDDSNQDNSDDADSHKLDDEGSQDESVPDPLAVYPDGFVDPVEAKGPCVFDGGLWFKVRYIQKKKNIKGVLHFVVRFCGDYVDTPFTRDKFYASKKMLDEATFTGKRKR